MAWCSPSGERDRRWKVNLSPHIFSLDAYSILHGPSRVGSEFYNAIRLFFDGHCDSGIDCLGNFLAFEPQSNAVGDADSVPHAIDYFFSGDHLPLPFGRPRRTLRFSTNSANAMSISRERLSSFGTSDRPVESTIFTKSSSRVTLRTVLFRGIALSYFVYTRRQMNGMMRGMKQTKKPNRRTSKSKILDKKTRRANKVDPFSIIRESLHALHQLAAVSQAKNAELHETQKNLGEKLKQFEGLRDDWGSAYQRVLRKITLLETSMATDKSVSSIIESVTRAVYERIDAAARLMVKAEVSAEFSRRDPG